MAVTSNFNRRPVATPARKAVIVSEDPIIRTAKIIQNERGTYEVRYSFPREDGKGWRSKTHALHTRDPEEAKRAFDRFLNTAAAATQTQVPEDQLTVEDVCAAYVTERPEQRHSLVLVRELLGHVRLVDLTPDRVKQFRGALVHLKDNTVRRRLGALKAAINHAREQGLTQRLPQINMPPAGPPRTLHMTKEQLALVWDKAQALAQDQPGPTTHGLKVFIWLAANFGARREAIRELTWDRVNWDLRTVSFKNPARAESRKRRAVCALSDDMILTLKEFWLQAGRPTEGHVVAISHDTLRYAFDKFMTAIGLPWVTSHVFRHTVATHMLMDGESIYHVAMWLADSVKTIESTYANVAPADIRAVADRRKIG